MKLYLLIFYFLSTLLLAGCTPSIGFGLGTTIGGPNGGADILITQDGVHGSVVAGGDFVR